MRKIIIAISTFAICAAAQAQYARLTTADGDTYTGITYQRVDPDGLYIEYKLPGGGLGMSKIKCGRLPDALQKQYGFTVAAARGYEAAVAQANDDLAKDLTRRYEAERAARARRDAENANAYPARMAQIARINAEQAAAFYRSLSGGITTDGRPNTSSFQSGYYADFAAGHTSTQTSFSPATPDVSLNREMGSSIRTR